MSYIPYKNPKSIFCIAFIALTAVCCRKDDPLSLKRTEFTGSHLRTDGYYYHDFNDSREVQFLFRNGVVMNLNSSRQKDMHLEEQLFKNPEWIKKCVKFKPSWGLFVVQDSFIRVEKWHFAEGGDQAFVEEGKILNDTTFHIYKSYRYNGTKVNSRNITYHFKALQPKPDSTNPYIP